jgi:flavin-dependent dehydrogenase
MSERLIDLAIIGGGPAGTAAALEARRRGLSVTVWEKDRFPRDKVCGEFISSESISFLESQIPVSLSRAPRITRAEFISRRGGAQGFPLPAAARGLSRSALDEALWRAAAVAGANVREGAAVHGVRRMNGQQTLMWEIRFDDGCVERARALIIACGRWWKIEGIDSPAGTKRRSVAGEWIGVKAHFRGVAARGAVEMYYFPGGYCGLAPIEDGLHNACCLVHRSLARRAPAGGMADFRAWMRTLAGHTRLDARLRDAIQESETVTTAPVRPARRCAVQGEILLAGDAAGFLDPFTGDGISMALHSGRLAAEELAKAPDRAPGAVRQAALSYERKLAKSVQRSYAVAGIFRALVRAPELVQDAAAAIIPFLGARLHAETRWRAARPIAEDAPLI